MVSLSRMASVFQKYAVAVAAAAGFFRQHTQFLVAILVTWTVNQFIERNCLFQQGREFQLTQTLRLS